MRARRFRGGIRAWLVLLVVTAALPGGVLLLRLAHAERDALSADLARNLARTAILASEQLRARMELAHGVLTSLADLPEVRAGDEERCTAAVRRARARERAFFANVAVASARGEIICSANPVASAAPNIADRLYFRRAMAANDLVIGEYILGRVVGRPVLTAASSANAASAAASPTSPSSSPSSRPSSRRCR
jgi:sugar/nucleoside kinase (ribokinase family)